MVFVALARWSCLVWVVARWGVREPLLFHVAAAWARGALSRRTAYFDLSWVLGHEFESLAFGVVRFEIGSLFVS